LTNQENSINVLSLEKDQFSEFLGELPMLEPPASPSAVSAPDSHTKTQGHSRQPSAPTARDSVLAKLIEKGDQGEDQFSWIVEYELPKGVAVDDKCKYFNKGMKLAVQSGKDNVSSMLICWWKSEEHFRKSQSDFQHTFTLAEPIWQGYQQSSALPRKKWKDKTVSMSTTIWTSFGLFAAGIASVLAFYSDVAKITEYPRVNMWCNKKQYVVLGGTEATVDLTFQNSGMHVAANLELFPIQIESQEKITDGDFEIEGGLGGTKRTIDPGKSDTDNLLIRFRRPGHYVVKLKGKAQAGMLWRGGQEVGTQTQITVVSPLGNSNFRSVDVGIDGTLCRLTFDVKYGAAFDDLQGTCMIFKQPGIQIVGVASVGAHPLPIEPAMQDVGVQVQAHWRTGKIEELASRVLTITLSSKSAFTKEQWEEVGRHCQITHDQI
jgi:hypothetical protein